MSQESLARAMRVARAELGLTVVDAVARVDIARSTWRDIENASRSRLTASVSRAIDQALEWEPGTADSIFHGYRDHPGDDAAGPRRDDIVAGQLAEIMARLSTLEAAPSWADEVLAAFEPLTPEDRRTWLRRIRQHVAS